MNEIHSCCLTIAGSDSGGNAGVQADLRTFHRYKLHGCSVITAVTAQNPFGVYGIEKLSAEIIGAQLNAVLGTYAIRALKTGMLAAADTVETVADALSRHPGIAKVIDPVMIATSGARLIDDDAATAIKRNLLGQATVITPNLSEAEFLSGMEITSREKAREAARRIYDSFGSAVVVKGGHFDGDAADTLFDGKDFTVFSCGRIAEPVSTHGTGCSFAAAIAAELALGAQLPAAVGGAKEYVRQAIAGSFFVGRECGVLGFAETRQSDLTMQQPNRIKGQQP